MYLCNIIYTVSIKYGISEVGPIQTKTNKNYILKAQCAAAGRIWVTKKKDCKQFIAGEVNTQKELGIPSSIKAHVNYWNFAYYLMILSILKQTS